MKLGVKGMGELRRPLHSTSRPTLDIWNRKIFLEKSVDVQKAEQTGKTPDILMHFLRP